MTIAVPYAPRYSTGIFRQGNGRDLLRINRTNDVAGTALVKDALSVVAYVDSMCMEVVSLGYRTDLALLRLGGTLVEDRGDHVVIRSPHNPTHWWGNFLLLSEVPPAEAAQPWLDRFAVEFPDADYVALGFDGAAHVEGDLDWFAQRGFGVEASVVMTAEAVHEPARLNTDAVCRPLDSDDDWAQSVELRMLCKDSDLDPASYRAFATAKSTVNRALVGVGHARWFGAFADGQLVAHMGLIAAGPQIARFQSVETAPGHRRKGLAGTLVHYASRWGFDELGAHTLVMVADPDYFAIDLYRAVGFEPTETQLQAEQRPPLHA